MSLTSSLMDTLVSSYDFSWLYQNSYGPKIAPVPRKEIYLWGASLASTLPISLIMMRYPSFALHGLDHEWR